MGHLRRQPKDPKDVASADHGKFVEVWRKQADGKWKCAVDIFNSDIPVPAAAPTPNKKT
jgi:ketosteroid isomerase-like protein